MGIAYLTHILTDSAGRVSWSVSSRRGEDPYGASITMQIPTPALILEVSDSIEMENFVEPDLATIGCSLVEKSLRSGFRRYESGPSVEIIAARSLLVYRAPNPSNKNDVIAAAQQLVGDTYRYHFVE